MRTGDEMNRDGPREKTANGDSSSNNLCLHFSDRWSVAVVLNDRPFCKELSLFSKVSQGFFEKESERNFRGVMIAMERWVWKQAWPGSTICGKLKNICIYLFFAIQSTEPVSCCTWRWPFPNLNQKVLTAIRPSLQKWQIRNAHMNRFWQHWQTMHITF